jgi:hypothetical protein
MKREFVPYEQALALKELGFDEHCFKYFSTEITHPENTLFNTRWGYEPEDSETSAPLYQQAFRWFREKYGLYHVINMFGDLDKPQYSYIVSGRTMTNPAHMWYYEDKDSHEETELACLKKLIEIVKTK